MKDEREHHGQVHDGNVSFSLYQEKKTHLKVWIRLDSGGTNQCIMDLPISLDQSLARSKPLEKLW